MSGDNVATRRRRRASETCDAGAEVAELATLELAGWPEGTRAICRREDPHPGAQLCFTDADGHRFQVFLTDQPDPDLAALELRHRQRACVEDRIRAAKATGLRNLPLTNGAATPSGWSWSSWPVTSPAGPGAAAGRRASGGRAQDAALPGCGTPPPVSAATPAA